MKDRFFEMENFEMLAMFFGNHVIVAEELMATRKWYFELMDVIVVCVLLDDCDVHRDWKSDDSTNEVHHLLERLETDEVALD